MIATTSFMEAPPLHISSKGLLEEISVSATDLTVKTVHLYKILQGLRAMPVHHNAQVKRRGTGSERESFFTCQISNRVHEEPDFKHCVALLRSQMSTNPSSTLATSTNLSILAPHAQHNILGSRRCKASGHPASANSRKMLVRRASTFQAEC